MKKKVVKSSALNDAELAEIIYSGKDVVIKIETSPMDREYRRVLCAILDSAKKEVIIVGD